MDKTAAENTLSAYGISPVQAAQAIGAMHALSEAGCTVKEAADYLGTTEEVVAALAALSG